MQGPHKEKKSLFILALVRDRLDIIECFGSKRCKINWRNQGEAETTLKEKGKLLKVRDTGFQGECAVKWARKEN